MTPSSPRLFFGRFSKPHVLGASAALLLVGGGLKAHAAPFTWTGGSSDSNNWTVIDNWDDGLAFPDGTNFVDSVTFAGSVRTTPVVDGSNPFKITGLTFASGADAFRISGNDIALNSGAIINNSSVVQTIDSNIVLQPTGAVSSQWNGGQSASSGVIFNGNVTLTTAQTYTIFYRGNGHTVTFNGVISNTAGTFNFSRTDSGTIFLNNANNSYNGLTSVSYGTISTPYVADSGMNSGIGAGTAIRLGQNQNGAVGIGKFQFTGTSGGSTNRTIQLSTGVGSAGQLNGGFNIENTVSGKTLTLSGNIVYAGGSTTTHGSMQFSGAGIIEVSGDIQTTGASLTKVSAGNLILSGTGNTYAGGTTVNTNSGALLANNASGSATGTGAVTVNSGSSLGGTGRLAPTGGNTVTVNGTLKPGDFTLSGTASVGTLAIDSDLSLANNSTFALTLGGSIPGDGIGYSQLNLTNTSGGLTLGSNVTLSLSVVGGYVATAADRFYILSREDAGSFSTLFAGATEGGSVNLGNGQTGLITYQANWSGSQATSTLDGGNDVAIYNVVPEPSALTALCGGLGLLTGFRRLRRRSRS